MTLEAWLGASVIGLGRAGGRLQEGGGGGGEGGPILQTFR